MRERVLRILSHPHLELPLEYRGGSGAVAPPSVVLVCDQILAFLAEWHKWSLKIDLTSEVDEQSILEKHIFDSLQYARALKREGRTLDIGSGGGFPGIPLKIIFPDMPMVLVESRRKRASFLQSVARTLGLKNIEIIHCRAEDLGKREGYCGQFDQVTFKAVAPLSQCLEWGLPFLKSGGHIVVKKEPVGSGGDKTPDKNFAGKLRLLEAIPIQSFAGVTSDLLVFEKCST